MTTFTALGQQESKGSTGKHSCFGGRQISRFPHLPKAMVRWMKDASFPQRKNSITGTLWTQSTAIS
ncbi:hypothetical protein [Endozoicomonas sp. ONNA2]|uniref:hypothetical protein n=1 Tax=Endozoicomonas sp. ONNA2 TaxID=2828741 RepID=UPI0021496161|nr:hypothetical protein [Endozoicomonas sp. ONNA2]